MKTQNPTLWKFVLIFLMLLCVSCSSHFTSPTRAASTSTFAFISTLTPVPTVTPTKIAVTGRIAFVSTQTGKKSIFLMNMDDGSQKDLTANLAFSFDPAWSPDGQQIAFTTYKDSVEQIYIMKSDGSAQKQLTSAKGRSFAPVWFPDGKQIAFLSNRDGVLSEQGVRIPEMYVMNVDGSDQQRLTNNQDFESRLSWSPTGDAIAVGVSVLTPSGIYFPIQIYLMDLKGLLLKRLTTNPYTTEPAWSSDGEFIAFSSHGIHVMKPDGSSIKCVIGCDPSQSGNYMTPSWSPDGSRIVFASNLDGRYRLYVVKADGSDLIRLTYDVGEETQPAWSPMP